MRTFVTLLLAGAAVAALATDASAQRRRVAPTFEVAEAGTSLPLTVNRRSWLDPGNSVSKGRGGGAAYVSANTAEFSKTQDKIFAPDRFGNASLPGQPYVPGRSVPVVSFSTTPTGAVDVDNVLHYQPY